MTRIVDSTLTRRTRSGREITLKVSVDRFSDDTFAAGAAVVELDGSTGRSFDLTAGNVVRGYKDADGNFRTDVLPFGPWSTGGPKRFRFVEYRPEGLKGFPESTQKAAAESFVEMLATRVVRNFDSPVAQERFEAEIRINRRLEGRCVNCGRPDAEGECAICTVSYASYGDE